MKAEQHIVDVKKVIEDNLQVKSLRDLEREGRRTVKVVRASRISEMIEEAVERAIAERSMQVVEEEKHALIESTNDEFRRLVHEATEERKKSEHHREKVTAYEKEILELKHKLELGEHIHAEDARLLAEQREVVDDLKEKVKSLSAELDEILHRGREEEAERVKVRAKLEATLGENERLRNDLSRAAKLRDDLAEAAKERGDAEAKLREHLAEAQKERDQAVSRMREAVAKQAESEEGGRKDDETIRNLVDEVKSIREAFVKGLKDDADAGKRTAEENQEMMSKLEGVISSKMDQIAKQFAQQYGAFPKGELAEPVQAAKIVLDGLFADSGKVESNLSKLEVKSTEAKGIGKNLERLKQLHRKGLGSSGEDPKSTGKRRG